MIAAREEAASWQYGPSGLRGLDLVVVDGGHKRPRLSSALCFALADGGPVRIGPGRQAFPTLGSGQLLVRAPTQLVPCTEGDGAQLRLLLVDRALLAGYGDLAQRLTRFASTLIDTPEVVEAARWLFDAVAAGADGELIRQRLGELLLQTSEPFTAQRGRLAPLSPAVVRTRNLLHERYAQHIPLEEISRAVSVSKCHLVHLFHKEMGLPPHAYQIQLRVVNAQQLVAQGTPLAEIASLTGFSDQSHFTRLFKRVVGVSPGRYASTFIGVPSMRHTI